MTEVADIATVVRQRVVNSGIDLDYAIHEELESRAEYSLRAGAAPVTVPTVRDVHNALLGFGDLQPYFDDDAVEEIWINNSRDVFVARNGVTQRVDVAMTAELVRDLVDRLLRTSGRRVDVSQPFVDASLPDGSRLHVAIPPVAHGGWSVNVRRFPPARWSLRELVAAGALSADLASFLGDEVRAGATILVSGATQAGKTTMLTALLGEADPQDRVVTVEETCEIRLATPDHVALQCRPPSLEGTGEITLRRLVKEALRMRPTRLVVGEVREAEALDVLIAINSGLPSMCTIHANSARDAVTKLATLPLLAGRNIDAAFVTPAVASALDLVVHCALDADGARRVAQVVRVRGMDSRGAVVCDDIVLDEAVSNPGAGDLA